MHCLYCRFSAYYEGNNLDPIGTPAKRHSNDMPSIGRDRHSTNSSSSGIQNTESVFEHIISDIIITIIIIIIMIIIIIIMIIIIIIIIIIITTK